MLHEGESADESESVESQDEEMRDAAAERGWEIVTEYSDPGISASAYTKKRRPEWDRLVADIPSGKFRVVMLWETARGDRKPREWLDFLYLCREHDVLIHIIAHDIPALGVTYNMRNDVHLDKLSREGLDNAKSSAETSARQRRVKRRLRMKGRPDGAIPYGMMRVYDPTTGKIVKQQPQPETINIVVEIFERLAAYHKGTRIMADLMERGVPAPGGGPKWHAATLRNIAMNWAYIGKIKHGDQVYDAQWDAVIDEGLFHKVQSILASRSAKFNAAVGKIRRTRPGRAVHLQSYIAECGVEGCGEVMSANISTKTPVYFCKKGHNAINMKWLDLRTTAVVLQYCAQPSRFPALVADDDAAATAAEAEVSAIETELEALYVEAEAGEYTPRLAASLEKGLKAKLEDAQRRVTEAAVPPELRDLMAGPVEELADRWVAMGEHGPAAHREIIRRVVRVVVHSAGGRIRKGDKQMRPEDRVEYLPAV